MRFQLKIFVSASVVLRMYSVETDLKAKSDHIARVWLRTKHFLLKLRANVDLSGFDTYADCLAFRVCGL